MGKHGQYRALVGARLTPAMRAGRPCGLAAALALAQFALAGPAVAECRLALVLALDVSASVDAREDALQRQGLAAALIAPDVEAAFLADPERPVWLTVFEWSGQDTPDMLLDWRKIASEDSLVSAAGTLANSRRGRSDMPTALGNALGHAAGLLSHGPHCAARTIDVSGDGRNNEGYPPASAYRAFPLDGVTVNGLAIAGGELDLAHYYERELIHGEGAFVIEAAGFTDYRRAMTEKLERELAGPVIGWLGSPPPAGGLH